MYNIQTMLLYEEKISFQKSKQLRFAYRLRGSFTERKYSEQEEESI
jgi:hypothetical protein